MPSDSSFIIKDSRTASPAATPMKGGPTTCHQRLESGISLPAELAAQYSYNPANEGGRVNREELMEILRTLKEEKKGKAVYRGVACFVGVLLLCVLGINACLTYVQLDTRTMYTNYLLVLSAAPPSSFPPVLYYACSTSTTSSVLSPCGPSIYVSMVRSMAGMWLYRPARTRRCRATGWYQLRTARGLFATRATSPESCRWRRRKPWSSSLSPGTRCALILPAGG